MSLVTKLESALIERVLVVPGGRSISPQRNHQPLDSRFLPDDRFLNAIKLLLLRTSFIGHDWRCPTPPGRRANIKANGRRSSAYQLLAVPAVCNFASTSSMEKLPGFWRGG